MRDGFLIQPSIWRCVSQTLTLYWHVLFWHYKNHAYAKISHMQIWHLFWTPISRSSKTKKVHKAHGAQYNFPSLEINFIPGRRWAVTVSPPSCFLEQVSPKQMALENPETLPLFDTSLFPFSLLVLLFTPVSLFQWIMRHLLPILYYYCVI